MTPAEALASILAAFEGARRPERFIRGTCGCDECLEHERTMAANTPETMSLADFGNAGWDPICFADDAAFEYFLPGMSRLAFAWPEYVSQLLFHLNCPGRVEALTRGQARAVRDGLWAMVESRNWKFASPGEEADFSSAIDRLDQRCEGHDGGA